MIAEPPAAGLDELDVGEQDGERSEAPPLPEDTLAALTEAFAGTTGQASGEHASTLSELAASSILPCQDLGDVVLVQFASRHAAGLTLQVIELSDSLVGFYAHLPDVPDEEELAYRGLLHAGYSANYVKAFLRNDAQLVMAAEVPLASLTRERFTGICLAVAGLADIDTLDLVAGIGFKEQLDQCVATLSRSIRVDGEAEAERLATLMAQADLPLSPFAPGALLTTMRLLGADAPCVVRLQSACISFIVHLEDATPSGGDTLRELLRLNEAVDVAKCGMDDDGDLVMLYEVPSLHGGIVEHLTAQFTQLLIGIAKAVRGS